MTPETNLVDHYTKMGKLTQMARLLGIKNLTMHHRNQKTNLETQSRVYRREMLGDENTESDDEDMGDHTVLGNVTHPTPIVVAGQQSSGNDFLKGLAIAALGAAIPGAGIAGYLVNQAINNPTPIVQPVTPAPVDQNDFSVGLGKIEDYLKQD
jgi:hypothetical protein